MTFTAGNLFPSHSCIGWPESSPTGIRTLVLQLERQTIYQLSYPCPHIYNYLLLSFFIVVFPQMFETETQCIDIQYVMHRPTDDTWVYNTQWNVCLHALLGLVQVHRHTCNRLCYSYGFWNHSKTKVQIRTDNEYKITV